MAKYLTAGNLFTEVNNILEKDGLLPDILDYKCVDSENASFPITSTEFDVYGIVNFGGNEGIYLNIHLKGYPDGGNDLQYLLIGTYKTLYDDKESFKTMASLMTEFVFAAKKWINEHYDMLDRTGIAVTFKINGKSNCRAHYSSEKDFVKSLNSYRSGYYKKYNEFEFYDKDSMQVTHSLYTWDGICNRADGVAHLSAELKAKDEARYNLRDLILSVTGEDIEKLESPEEAIENYLREREELYLFDESGNLFLKSHGSFPS